MTGGGAALLQVGTELHALRAAVAGCGRALHRVYAYFEQRRRRRRHSCLLFVIGAAKNQ